MASVLHVLPHAGGGAETYLVALADALPELRHERFALSAGRTAAQAAASLPRRAPRLLRAARAADAIHVHGDAAAILAAPLLRARPALITTHGLHLTRRRPVLRGALGAAAFAADVVICTSQAERDELRFGRVIHNAAPPVAEPDPAARAAIRIALGLADADVAVLFAGRLEPRKRARLAAEAVTRAGAPFVLLVAGDGPDRPDPSRRVRVLGHRDDLPALLGAADLFVAPADREGLSYAVLEALAAGLPVVASDGPGNPEAVGDAGLVVGAGDAAALAQALRDAAEDRDALAAIARDRAATVFGREAFVAATRAAYADAGAL